MPIESPDSSKIRRSLTALFVAHRRERSPVSSQVAPQRPRRYAEHFSHFFQRPRAALRSKREARDLIDEPRPLGDRPEHPVALVARQPKGRGIGGRKAHVEQRRIEDQLMHRAPEADLGPLAAESMVVVGLRKHQLDHGIRSLATEVDHHGMPQADEQREHHDVPCAPEVRPFGDDQRGSRPANLEAEREGGRPDGGVRTHDLDGLAKGGCAHRGEAEISVLRAVRLQPLVDADPALARQRAGPLGNGDRGGDRHRHAGVRELLGANRESPEQLALRPTQLRHQPGEMQDERARQVVGHRRLVHPVHPTLPAPPSPGDREPKATTDARLASFESQRASFAS